MVSTKLNLSLNEPYVRTVYAKEGDTGRVFNLDIDPTPTENGTLRIKRPNGVEVTSSASSGGEEVGTSFTTIADGEFTALETEINPIQDLHGQSNPYPAGGGKNLLPTSLANLKEWNVAGTWSGNTYTYQTVTFAVAVDGGGNVISINVNGTASAYCLFYLSKDLTFTADTTLNGCPSGGSTSGYRIQAEGGTTRQDTGSGAIIPANESKTRIIIVVPQSTSVTSAVFKPMLRYSSVTDSTYAPYSNICPIYPGNGVNLLPKGTDRDYNGITYTVNDDGSVKITGTASATSFWGVQFTLSAGTYTLSGCQSGGGNDSYLIDIRNAVGGSGVSGINGDSGNGSTFTLTSPLTAYVNIRVASGYAVPTGGIVLKPMIELGSTATPYVPYQGINVFQNGKNQFDITKSYYYVEGSNSITVSQGGYNANIFYNVNGNNALPSAYRKLLYLPQGTYTISFKNSTDEQKLQVYELDTDTGLRKDAFSVVSTGTTTDGRLYTTFTVPNNCYATIVRYINSSRTFSDIQLERNATSTAYEPYNGTTYPLSLGQSVYGGTLDVVSGKLTVTHGIQDLGELSWTKDTGAVRFFAPLSLAKKPSTNDSVFNGISSVAVATSLNYLGAHQNEDGLMALSTGGSLSVRVLSLMSGDATAFATAMSGQSVVYELATPTETTLSPQQISTLLGENNIFSDSGDVVDVAFTYDGMYAELPSSATSVVGRCIGDVELNGVSTMPFTLVVQKNNQGVNA